MKLALAAALGCALGACSLVVDTEGLSTGRADIEDASSREASTDEASAELPDAHQAVDAREEDAGLLDSGPDGEPVDAGPDAATSPCAVSHLFCDDFDTGALGARWDDIELTAGPLSLDGAAFVSPLRSLLATVQPQAGESVRNTSMRKVVGIPANKARFELDFRTEGPSAGPYEQVDLMTMALAPLPPGFSAQIVGLLTRPGGSAFEVYTTGPSAPGQFEKPVLVARSRWVHVAIEADFTKVPAAASVSFDGVVVATHQLAGSSLTSVTISIGPSYALHANVSFPLSYDNVLVDR